MPRNNRSPVQLVEILTRLAVQRVLWEPLIKFDPISRHYARLAAQDGFEAWLLTWVPGQGTDWHDHGGSAGESRAGGWIAAAVRHQAHPQGGVVDGDRLRLAESQLVGRNW